MALGARCYVKTVHAGREGQKVAKFCPRSCWMTPYLSEIMIFLWLHDSSIRQQYAQTLDDFVYVSVVVCQNSAKNDKKMKNFTIFHAWRKCYNLRYYLLDFLIVLFCLFFRFIYKLRKKNRKKKGQSIIIIYCFASLETKTKYKNQVQT